MRLFVYFFLPILFFAKTLSANSEKTIPLSKNRQNLQNYLKTLPAPYKNLATVLPFKDHGWSTSSQKYIAEVLQKRKPKVIFELGAWLGRTTFHMANIANWDATIYAVDTWKGNNEHYWPDRKTTRVNVHQLLPTLYEQFLSNVIHKKLTHKVVPWRMTTDLGAIKAKKEAFKIDFIYLDADHEEASVYRDLCNWYPLLSKTGLMSGDDWSRRLKGHYSVRAAVERFAREQKLKIHVAPDKKFWWLYR